MVPAAVVDTTIADLAAACSSRATSSSTAATPTTSTTSGAPRSSRRSGIHYVDVGTSGGVWGLERGYCLMIGGETAVVKHLDPIFAHAGARRRRHRRARPGREKIGGTAEQGYLHCGPNGAGHFVKMVHNGIEYGLMAAYAEGLNILRARQRRQARRTTVDAETTPLRDPEHYQYDFNLPDIAEVWRRGSVIASWLLDLTAAALRKDPDLSEFAGRVSDSGEGRWTIKAAIDEAVPAPVLTAALYERFSSRGEADFAGQAAVGDALRVRRTPREAGGKYATEEPAMSTSQSDALVFFGATGDLAYKKIFPALQAMVKRGHLDVPVIGVAKAGWNLEQLRARAQDSLEKHGGLDPAAFDKLCGLLRYVDGDYQDPATFQAIRKELGSAQRPAHYLAIPPALFGPVVEQLGQVGLRQGRPRHRREAVRRRPRLGAGAQPDPARHLRRDVDLPHRPLPRARGRSRTCSSSASPTRSWSRSGTATTSRACRSPWPRTSASRAAARFYDADRRDPRRDPEPPASRSWPTWRWSRRSGPTASRSATRRSRS